MNDRRKWLKIEIIERMGTESKYAEKGNKGFLTMLLKISSIFLWQSEQ